MGSSGGVRLYPLAELEALLPDIQNLFREHFPDYLKFFPDWGNPTLGQMAYAHEPYTALWLAEDYPFLKQDLFRLTYGTGVEGFPDALYVYLENHAGVRFLLTEETWT